MSKQLTPKEKMFITEYCKDFNGTRAAKAAGYSENSACEIASENLRKPHIRKSVRDYLDLVVADKNKIIRDNIELWQNMVVSPESSEQAKLKASEYLAKYVSMFTEKSEVLHKTLDDEGEETGINVTKMTTEELAAIAAK